MAEEINVRELILYLNDIYLNSHNRRVVFVVGAGVSRAAGIPTGVALAKRWLSELENVKPAKFDEWKKAKKINKNNLGASYTDIYAKRFSNNIRGGLEALEKEIVGKTPSYGHTVLAQYMAAKQHNVVITTNFDNLIEQSFYFYTQKTPMICGHESLAAFAEASPERPLIIKVHNDIFFNPKNSPTSTATLDNLWEKAFNELFHDNKNIAMVVIGYGGNDGSLMKYLIKLNKLCDFYWCLYDNEKASPAIKELINKQNGKYVRFDGFDEMMHRLRISLALPDLGEMITKVSDERKNAYGKRVVEIQNTIKNTEDKELKSESEHFAKVTAPIDWWQWESKAVAAKNDDEKNAIYQKGIKKTNSPSLIVNYAIFLAQNKKDYAAAERYYKKALQLVPNSPLSNDAYASFLLGKTYRVKPKEKKELLEKALKFALESNKLVPNYSAYNLSCIYTLMGNKENALKYLEEDLKSTEKTDLKHIQNDKDLDEIRGDKKFIELIKKYFPGAK